MLGTDRCGEGNEPGVRAFVAIPLPEAAYPALDEVLAALPADRWRAAAPESRHLTLRFLGEVPTAAALALGARLAPRLAATPAFSLELAGLGAFPQARRPEVLWAGCGPAGAAGLRAVAAVVAEVAGGLDGPSPPFRPHLTLARRRRAAAADLAAADVRRLCAAHAGRLWGRLEVSGVVVYSSVLGPGGARHTPIVRLPLAPKPVGHIP